MEVKDIEKWIKRYREDGKSLFLTSSFQSHSIPLIHIVSQIDNTIPVYFNNTGFHFPKLLQFRDHIAELLNVNVIDTVPIVPKIQQLDGNGNFMYASDPDECCYLNKVKPMENIMIQHDVWINGVRADQSSTRAAMKIEQQAPFNTLRFHPMLDWSKQDIYRYKSAHNLPDNPLEAEGYFSIGCAPCTAKFDLEAGSDRQGRWQGMNKTECGLHTDLAGK